MTPRTWGRHDRWRQGTATEVPCPGCNRGHLAANFSCLGTDFRCPSCQTTYRLADLVHELDDEAFALLAGTVDGRLSDRVW